MRKELLEELALPYAIMDTNGRMIWSNKVFSELTGKDQFYKKNISTIFPDITADKLPALGTRRIPVNMNITGSESGFTVVSMQMSHRWARWSHNSEIFGEL